MLPVRTVALVLALVLGAQGGFASEPGQVSLAAERRAGFRAIAAMDPDERVRNPDYLAGELLPPMFWVLGPLVKDYARTREFVRAFHIRDYHLANAMTRHVDGILESAVAERVTQVVTIGAGFDSRPYRLGRDMPAVRFFEVDQPATLQAKMERVRAVLGGLPDNVTYVSIDYRARPVFDALRAAGFDRRRKTLFIWEGTSVFTQPAVVDATLRYMASSSGPASELVFDYVAEALVRGNFDRHPGAKYEVVRSGVNGEPWVFGIAEGESRAFVAARGLDVVSDLGAGDLADRYLSRSDGSRDGTPTRYWRVLHAAVRK